VGLLIKYKQRKENAAKRRSLVVYYHQDSTISEQYRRIYTNIKYCSLDQAHRSILVTSPGYKEGKSTTTINLGASIAQLGEKVLIIDADLRQPTLHDLFKLENNLGMTNILQGKSTFEDTVNHTGISTLDILTSGPIPVNPAKLLGSNAMKKLMQVALNSYDIVLIDTPPYLEVTDANILASLCSGIVFVTQYGKTKKEKVLEAKHLIELSGARVIGSIINGKGK
jgi:protein-tyrosine kinase